MIQGTFSPRDLKDANWSHLRPRRTLAVVGLLVVAAFCWALWFAFFGAWSADVGWLRWAMLAAGIYLIGFFAIGIPYKVRRTYRQRKDLQRPCAFLPSESGLGVETEGSRGVKPWSDYLKWKEGKSVFLLYMSDHMYQVIPKHFFSSPDEVNSFRNLLEQKVARREA